VAAARFRLLSTVALVQLVLTGAEAVLTVSVAVSTGAPTLEPELLSSAIAQMVIANQTEEGSPTNACATHPLPLSNLRGRRGPRGPLAGIRSQLGHPISQAGIQEVVFPKGRLVGTQEEFSMAATARVPMRLATTSLIAVMEPVGPTTKMATFALAMVMSTMPESRSMMAYI